MHGMLSLAVLVAALAVLAAWVGYLLVRLYRACPAPRSTRTLPVAGDLAEPGPEDPSREDPGPEDLSTVVVLADAFPADDHSGPGHHARPPWADNRAGSLWAGDRAGAHPTGDPAEPPTTGDPAEPATTGNAAGSPWAGEHTEPPAGDLPKPATADGPAKSGLADDDPAEEQATTPQPVG
jgi:hypothetical protein